MHSARTPQLMLPLVSEADPSRPPEVVLQEVRELLTQMLLRVAEATEAKKGADHE